MVAVVAWGLPRSSKLALALGALPPMALFVIEQRAVTGAFFTSSQAAYYALADGPPGCFRYGFGAGIGCLHEHGEYVAAVLPTGFTWKAVAMTTLRRLHLHFMDLANADPLMLLVALSPVVALRQAKRDINWQGAWRIASLGAGVVLIVLVYAPFYFDGSYPGGGARFFADVIPLEHVMLATAAAFLVSPSRARRGGSRIDLPRFAPLILATSLAGFGLRTASDHVALREREGGRPFFEPDILTEAGVHRGLLFAGTDHAFNLAFDPAARDAAKALVVARSYGDDRDRLVWESHGRPAAYRYVFSGALRPITQAHRMGAPRCDAQPSLRSGGRMAPPRTSGGIPRAGVRDRDVRLRGAPAGHPPRGGCPLSGRHLGSGPFGRQLPRSAPASRPAKPSALGFALRAEPSQAPQVWDFAPPPQRILDVLYPARKAREFSVRGAPRGGRRGARRPLDSTPSSSKRPTPTSPPRATLEAPDSPLLERSEHEFRPKKGKGVDIPRLAVRAYRIVRGLPGRTG